jgi:ferritin-like metal-binding protein YciE
MPADDLQEQIVKYLTDVHSVEENAAAQLRTGADAVEDEQLALVLREHLTETEEHERLVRERLEALDAIGGAMSGAAPDTTGKVAIQAFATEHLEIASYRSLRAAALRAGDSGTADMAERILVQEQAAAQKLDALLEQAALVGLPQTAA